jgi:hypothetical protein
MSSPYNNYLAAISSFVSGYPPGTPIITVSLAMDRVKPGFWIPESGWIDPAKFRMWWNASRTIIRNLEKGIRP